MMSTSRILQRWVPARSRRAVLLAILVFGSVLSYLVISRLIVDRVEVLGHSMSPGLREGDMFLLHRYPYLFDKPANGDVVALRDPQDGELSVKRIIAVPGDQIHLSRGVVTLNGSRLEESYVKEQGTTHTVDGKAYTLTLAEDQYFVLGDNRRHSMDSRISGPVDRDCILGKIRSP